MDSAQPNAVRHRSRRPRRPAARLATISLGGVLAIGGAGLLYIGTRSPDALKSALDRAASGGTATQYPLERCTEITSRALAAGIALLLVAAFLWLWPPATRFAAPVLRGARVWARSIPRVTLRFAGAEPATFWALILITAAAAAIRLSFLSMEIRGDEADTLVSYASKSLPQAIAEYSNPNNHVLNTVLTALMVKLLGTDVWQLRLPVFILGVALVPAVFALTRALYRPGPAAITAALAAAFSPYVIYYGVNIRGYTHIMLAFTIGLILSARLLRRPRSPLTWTVWAAAAALGFWAIPTMLYPFGALCTWLGLHALLRLGSRDTSLLRSLIFGGTLTVLLTLALYLPILVASGPEPLTNNRFVRPMQGSLFWAELRDRGGTFLELMHAGVPWWVGATLAGCAGLALLAHGRIGRQRLPALVAMLLWSTLLLAWMRVPPYARVWTFALPVWCGMVGAGVAFLASIVARSQARWLAPALVAAALGIPLLLHRAPERIDEGSLFLGGREVAGYMKENLGPADRVIMTWPALPALNYHGQRLGIPPFFFDVWGDDRPFTHALLDSPLDEFNKKLEFVGYPALRPGAYSEVRAFAHAVLVRLKEPLPGRVAHPN
jgi:uncharacterized membrane protein YecN with MAPEG domain